jgi:hypothetical protein
MLSLSPMSERADAQTLAPAPAPAPAPEDDSEGRRRPYRLPLPPIVRALAVTSGRAAAQRAAPLLFGIAVTCAVLFGGNGMDAHDLTSLCARARAVRGGLWAVWLLAATPAARALLGERSAMLWRSLPIPRWHHYAVTAALLCVLELPMAILYGRGSGVVAGLAMTAYALAAHSLLCSDGTSPRTWLLGAALGAALLAPQVPERSPLLWLGSAVTVAMALPAAWRRAAGRPMPREWPLVRGPATVALLLGHVSLLLRTQRPLLLRATLLFGVALAITHLTLVNNHIQRPAARTAMALLALSPLALLAAGALAGPVLQGERTLVWLLRSTGTGGAQLVVAAQGAVMTLVLPLGIAYGVLIARLHGLLPDAGLRLVGECLLCTLCAACVVTGLLRWALRGDPRDGDRVLMLQLALVPASLLATWALGELALVPWLLGALFSSAYALSLAAPLTRYGRLRRERMDRERNQVNA